MPGSDKRECTGAAEEIGNQVAGIGRGQNNPLDERLGFLGRVAGPLVVQTGHDREIPPILRDFPALQVWDFSETSLGGLLEGLNGIAIVRLPDHIGIESIVIAFGVDKDGIVFTVECATNGGRSVVGPDDFI